MSKKEYGFYNFAKDWDFSFIKSITENLTNWDMIEEIKKRATKGSKILDLGTGGGERVLEEYPEVQEIIGTDFSDAMIQTANENLVFG